MPLKRITRFGPILAGAVAVAALLAVSALTGGSRPALALTDCAVADMTFDAQEREFLRLINEYRAENGLGPLTVSNNLNRSASWMARDLAVNHYISHTDSLGRTFDVRIADCEGLPNSGENIAAGTIKDTAAEAFEMWRNSPGHNANMLEASYQQIGIARYYDAGSPYSWYWVTDFSTSDDSTSAPTGSDQGAGSGGTNSPPPIPTPTPTSTTSTNATMTGPADGATIGSTQLFTWDPGSNAGGYRFTMGTSEGSSNFLDVTMGANTTGIEIYGLPSTGQMVYVRLYTQTPSGWEYNDYVYRLPGGD